MQVEGVNRCQIQEWYPKFKSVSIKTLIHEIPETFVQYLSEDGPFILPHFISGEDALPRRIHNLEEEEDFKISEDSDDDSEPTPSPSFPEFELAIKDSIKTLGGAVFPKLNWSAPKDSAWMSTTGNLRCTSFSEVTLLLKSSDSLVHDLCHAYDSCSDKVSSRPPTFFLALRKWYPTFHPQMEFRCFVRNQRLIGISQREVSVFNPDIIQKKHELEMLIKEFFTRNVQQKFESENYTFDVYVKADTQVKLVDFNPWADFTLPLLFTWEDLQENLEEDYIQFKVVESQGAVLPGLKTAVPYDYLDTSPGSGWDEFLSKADEEFRKQAMSPNAGA
ncbi:hypothetical protein AQUCO_09600012v1 [Aquilegia coerulea]|uniref:Cell division cycle protein 123 homolog n=1 Tax=Aquilegia coerulea TaxID=218851 RepID=A0A2G5C4F9_AQUCA|nr:hypothetical protein AQUCO_09600012v1 [Aquilegia coerulea]